MSWWWETFSNPASKLLDGVPLPAVPFGGPWLLFGAGAMIAVACHQLQGNRLQFHWRLGAGAVVILALRLVLGIWGPHHVNGQGPHWISSALGDLGVLQSYGPGYAELFAPVALLGGPSPDYAIFASNALLSTMTVFLLYLLCRRTGLPSVHATCAAAILALDPLSVRFAASESYFIPVTFLVLAEWVCLAEATMRLGLGRRGSVLPLVFAAALLGAQAARVHPVAWIPVCLGAVSPFLFIFIPHEATGPGDPAAVLERPTTAARSRIVFAAAASCIVLVVLFFISGGWMWRVVHQLMGPQTHAGHFAPIWPGHGWRVDVAVILTALAASVVARWKLEAPLPAVIVSLCGLIFFLLTRRQYQQTDFWQASYFRIWLPFLIPGFIGMFPGRLLAPTPLRRGIARVADSLPVTAGGEGKVSPGPAVLRNRNPFFLLFPAVVVAVAVAALALPVLKDLFYRTTEQLEYAFLREEIGKIPAECTLVVPLSSRKRALRIPDYLSDSGPVWGPSRVADVESLEQAVEIVDRSSCAHFVWVSSCSQAPFASTCAALEGLEGLKLIAEASFPPRPSYPMEPYRTDTVRVAVYRVEPRHRQ